MKISKEELLHIVELSNLKISDDEVDRYLKNLEDIVEFANKVNDVDTEGLSETIGANENYNVFRKDEVVDFGDHESLLNNSKEIERNMFKIPKVI
jgi:aspartyl-tRNA(Asn)/glutamyl-tRNA(Gln) amidotransferase subunit C